MTVWVISPDLMDQSRFRAVLGDRVRFVTSFDGILPGDIAVIDLRRGVTPPPVATRTVAFGSHVDRRVLADARAAGWQEVYPRSELFRILRELFDGKTTDGC